MDSSVLCSRLSGLSSGLCRNQQSCIQILGLLWLPGGYACGPARLDSKAWSSCLWVMGYHGVLLANCRPKIPELLDYRGYLQAALANRQHVCQSSGNLGATFTNQPCSIPNSWGCLSYFGNTSGIQGACAPRLWVYWLYFQVSFVSWHSWMQKLWPYCRFRPSILANHCSCLLWDRRSKAVVIDSRGLPMVMTSARTSGQISGEISRLISGKISGQLRAWGCAQNARQGMGMDSGHGQWHGQSEKELLGALLGVLGGVWMLQKQCKTLHIKFGPHFGPQFGPHFGPHFGPLFGPQFGQLFRAAF